MAYILLENNNQYILMLRGREDNTFRSLDVFLMSDDNDLYFNLFMRRMAEYHDAVRSQVEPELIEPLDIPTDDL